MPQPVLEYRAYTQSLLSTHDLKHAASVPLDGKGTAGVSAFPASFGFFME
jgi:hypothetical protein